MKKIEIFDPAMCCSTGVCGPGVDPELLRMATIVANLQKADRDISRHNLSEEPQIYVDNQAVNTVLMNEGVDALPITLVDGEVVRRGEYPSNDELMAWSSITQDELVRKMLEVSVEKSKSTGCCGDRKSDGCC